MMPAACFYQDQPRCLALLPLPPLPLPSRTVHSAGCVWAWAVHPSLSQWQGWASCRYSKNGDCVKSESPILVKMALFVSCLNIAKVLQCCRPGATEVGPGREQKEGWGKGPGFNGVPTTMYRALVGIVHTLCHGIFTIGPGIGHRFYFTSGKPEEG